LVWNLAWRSGKGRLEGQGIPEVAQGVFLEKIGKLYYSAEVNRSAQIQGLVLYTGSFCFAPLAFHNCAFPPFLLYRLCHLPMIFHPVLTPCCMHVIRGSSNVDKQRHMQISPTLFYPLGILLKLTSRRPCPFHSSASAPWYQPPRPSFAHLVHSPQ
jgi:hypothetical protein